MVNFKEIYHFPRLQRGVQHFPGGFQRCPGGSNCFFPIETHITCDFPGGGGGSTGGHRTPCPGGGGTLIFSYIRRLGSFFWVQNFEFQYFWGFSERQWLEVRIRTPSPGG